MKQILTVTCSKTFDETDDDAKEKIEKDSARIAKLARRLGFTVMSEQDNLARGDPENSK